MNIQVNGKALHAFDDFDDACQAAQEEANRLQKPIAVVYMDYMFFTSTLPLEEPFNKLFGVEGIRHTARLERK